MSQQLLQWLSQFYVDENRAGYGKYAYPKALDFQWKTRIVEPVNWTFYLT